ncbi:MAG: hypothetical protein K0S55_1875, partial [Clostridia bacterium]|nr:hypothetical protein [Clostridia bacterium]
MSVIKRAWRNVIRLQRSFFMLFLAVAVISAVAAIAFSVKNSAADEFTRISENYITIAVLSQKTTQNWNESRSVLAKDLEYLINSPYTTAYSYQQKTPIQRNDSYNIYPKTMQYSDIIGGERFIEYYKSEYIDFEVVGVKNIENSSILRGGKIIDGKLTDGYSALLEGDFAKEQGLSIGDNLVLGKLGVENVTDGVWRNNIYAKDYVFTFKITVLYEKAKSSSMYKSTKIIIPIETANEINKIYSQSMYLEDGRDLTFDPLVSLTEIEFILDSPKNAD